jgi:hypothetical protein
MHKRIAGARARDGAWHAGAELPPKAFFPANDGKAATNETEEEFQWQQD